MQYYGHLNVKEPRGTAYIRDAIDKLSVRKKQVYRYFSLQI